MTSEAKKKILNPHILRMVKDMFMLDVVSDIKCITFSLNDLWPLRLNLTFKAKYKWSSNTIIRKGMLRKFFSIIFPFAYCPLLLVYLSDKINLKTLLFCICNSSWKYISIIVNFFLFKSGDTLSFLCFIFRSFSFLFKYTFSLYFLYFYFEQYS